MTFTEVQSSESVSNFFSVPLDQIGGRTILEGLLIYILFFTQYFMC